MKDQSTQWFSMSQAAKAMNKKIGRTRLYRFLRNRSILMDNNEPYQTYVDKGYFLLTFKEVKNRKGNYFFRVPVTLISWEGMQFIKQLLDKAVMDDFRGI